MISGVFIERPRLASVVSLVILLGGALALYNIPVAQFPDITPPEIQVNAVYPGANAEVVAESVAAPIESQVNGVENMLYMSSTSSNNGGYNLSVTFAVGTDPDIDQVNVLNRVKQAEPTLPAEVIAQGVTVRRRSSDVLGFVSFFSPGGTRDEVFLSNYVSINVRDVLARVPGVSDVVIFGALDYSMRIWMDPERLASLGLTADDVIAALQAQNIQAAAGSVGTAPASGDQQVQYTLRARGRLTEPSEFGDIIIRSNDEGGVLRIRDVARVDLGARSYGSNSRLNGSPSVAMAIYQTSGANALATMQRIRSELEHLSKRFPGDVKYDLTYDSTRYVSAAIGEIATTLIITFLLVVGVTYVFLQDWRSTLIPALTIPVSLIGTFAVLLIIGYSANTLTLFALILAIGVVVDDAIVVVENVQRLMQEENLSPKEAARKAMSQVTGAIVATTLVLLAVFVPVAALPGITGELYRQFAVTICVAVLLSAVNALTLSPALCSVLLRPPRERAGPYAWFRTFLEASRRGYLTIAGWLIRHTIIVAIAFSVVFAGAYLLFTTRPTSFLPNEDRGVIFLDVQLPEDAALARTADVSARILEILNPIPGIESVISVNGMSIISGAAENTALGVVILQPWTERTDPEQQLGSLLGRIRGEMAAIASANINAFVPPAISGVGRTGGFDFRLQALGDQSPQDLASALRAIVVAANRDPAIRSAFSTYHANVPQIFVDLDRDKAETTKVPVSRVFGTLQAQLGSRFVNDFNLYGRVFQVKVQADDPYRDTVDDIGRLYVRSDDGAMVPLSSLVTLSTVLGPQVVSRYNQFASAGVNGEAAPGRSSGEAMAAMERIAAETLPDGYGYDWSGLSFQEKKTRGQGSVLLVLALVFGYLFLVGQYESWTIPLPVIISISVASLGALVGLWIAGLELSIYAQIGLVLLVGLASKNAILIVEFSKTQREAGSSITEAALIGARLRYRPVLMTAFTFILGVFPLVIAAGAGAASRRAIGTTVFAGMLAATMVGILLIPALYANFQRLREKAHSLVGSKG